jgi:hypothetical protein
MNSKKTLGEILVEIVCHNILPAVLYHAAFVMVLGNMSYSGGNGAFGGPLLAVIFLYIPGLLTWLFVWKRFRTNSKRVSGPANPPELDSAERLKLSAEAVADKPGYSVGFGMGWFWRLVGVVWLVFLVWLVWFFNRNMV